MGQLVSGYLDFAERQAEREQVMTMADWAKHLDRILTMSGEQLLSGNGSVTHEQAVGISLKGKYSFYNVTGRMSLSQKCDLEAFLYQMNFIKNGKNNIVLIWIMRKGQMLRLG